MKKGLAMVVLLDGVATTVLGKRFLRVLNRRLPSPISYVAGFFLLWPGMLLRRGAAMQALAGLALLRTAED
ncbi:MAG TPA: hypothetical protein PKD09_13025 [Aggregatilinea sp.]|jgi:hypothetical protein|uniref:hypothetical protein n=1 Tax=Aggregatilinea sp. TaxID=2806333 RepID=UPI002BD21FA5|nr:hypothetical protein [Aggregatilinea sp.]HML22569.1 hypothetical protein [Aggregatilinea sp.]